MTQDAVLPWRGWRSPRNLTSAELVGAIPGGGQHGSPPGETRAYLPLAVPEVPCHRVSILEASERSPVPSVALGSRGGRMRTVSSGRSSQQKGFLRRRAKAK